MKYIFLLLFFVFSQLEAKERSIDVVLLIDNSQSMKNSDKKKQRAIAGHFILDEVELTSNNVRSAVVFFDTSIDGDDKLGELLVTHKRLDTGVNNDGGYTNMEGALKKAISLLNSSNSDEKLIVLLTDGSPDPDSQVDNIKNKLIPFIKSKQIKIVALGLSHYVNKPFLKEITSSTGGGAEFALTSVEMLTASKKLLRSYLNIHTEMEKHLRSAVSELKIIIPAGTDRARITVISDNPIFRKEQMSIEVDCEVDSETPYTIKDDGGGMEIISAWSAFIGNTGSSSKECMLKVIANKSGEVGHKGITVFLDVRSDLHGEILCRPTMDTYIFDTKINCEIDVKNSTGVVKGVNLKGKIISGDGGSTTLQINNQEFSFNAPSVSGHNSIEIEMRVSPKSHPSIIKYNFNTIEAGIATLNLNNENLDFGTRTPEESHSSQEVYLEVEYPNKHYDIPLTIRLIADEISSFVTIKAISDGNEKIIKKDGTKLYRLRKDKKLTLKIIFDYTFIKTGLNLKDGIYEGTINISSTKIDSPVEINFKVKLKAPSLDIDTEYINIFPFWRPDKPVKIDISNIKTDATGTVNVEIEPVLMPVITKKGNITIGDVIILHDSDSDSDKIVVSLERSGYLLQAKFSPRKDNVNVWDEVESTYHKAGNINYKSSFGINKTSEIKVLTLPIFFTIDTGFKIIYFSLYIQHILVIFCFLWILLVLINKFKECKLVYKWKKFRKGGKLNFNSGSLGIGEYLGGCELKNSLNSNIYNEKLADLSFNNHGELFISPKQDNILEINDLFPSKSEIIEIETGDIISIIENGKPLWKLRYEGQYYDSGTFSIDRSPEENTYSKINISILKKLAIFFVLLVILESDKTVVFIYGIPLISDFLMLIYNIFNG